MLAAQILANAHAIFIAQHHIQQNQINPPLIKLGQNLSLGRSIGHHKATALQEMRHHLAHLSVIIHDQKPEYRHGILHPTAVAGCPPFAPLWGLLWAMAGKIPTQSKSL